MPSSPIHFEGFLRAKSTARMQQGYQQRGASGGLSRKNFMYVYHLGYADISLSRIGQVSQEDIGCM
jgi:hypothetical protein